MYLMLDTAGSEYMRLGLLFKILSYSCSFPFVKVPQMFQEMQLSKVS